MLGAGCKLSGSSSGNSTQLLSPNQSDTIRSAELHAHTRELCFDICEPCVTSLELRGDFAALHPDIGAKRFDGAKHSVNFPEHHTDSAALHSDIHAIGSDAPVIAIHSAAITDDGRVMATGSRVIAAHRQEIPTETRAMP